MTKYVHKNWWIAQRLWLEKKVIFYRLDDKWVIKKLKLIFVWDDKELEKCWFTKEKDRYEECANEIRDKSYMSIYWYMEDILKKHFPQEEKDAYILQQIRRGNFTSWDNDE